MSDIIKKQEATPIQLTAFNNALAELEEIYQDMTMMQIRVFITIAIHQPITATELTASLSSSGPTVCRCVKLLSIGESNRRKANGLGLIEFVVDPQDKRRQILTLNQSGRLLAKVLSIRLSEVTKA